MLEFSERLRRYCRNSGMLEFSERLRRYRRNSGMLELANAFGVIVGIPVCLRTAGVLLKMAVL
jgi:hypothetical protein